MGGGASEADDTLPDDDTLILQLNQHVAIHVIRKGPHMWRILIGCLHTTYGKVSLLGQHIPYGKVSLNNNMVKYC